MSAKCPFLMYNGTYIRKSTATIDDSSLIESAEYSFSISVAVLKKVLPQWQSKMTFDSM